LPFISFIEPIDPTSVPENKSGKTLHRSNYINSPLNNGLHYDGTGVNVMMQDDGTIGPHIDYQGREDQSNVSSNGGDHGDHVAGTIMGAGNLDPQAEGMAPGAFLYVFSSSDNNPSAILAFLFKCSCIFPIFERNFSLSFSVNLLNTLSYLISYYSINYLSCEGFSQNCFFNLFIIERLESSACLV